MAYDKYRRLRYFGALVETGTASDTERVEFENAVAGLVLAPLENGRSDCYDRFIEANGYRLVTNYDPHDDVVADLPFSYEIISPDRRGLTLTTALREIVTTRWPDLMSSVSIDGIESAAAIIKTEA